MVNSSKRDQNKGSCRQTSRFAAVMVEIPRAFVCAKSKIFDVSEWAICQCPSDAQRLDDAFRICGLRYCYLWEVKVLKDRC
ncbi:hypothetical protein Vadar_027544 [Vaccinium darrowii]|uniref:Uncharacterized protein n=1 Tax=Vaccinium darrowii TaxID=229202 RepID=A0ACB7Y3R0_9ERIC|nr:hypothetical protein Vadar_027544 [Vaccinium darrowii]